MNNTNITTINNELLYSKMSMRKRKHYIALSNTYFTKERLILFMFGLYSLEALQKYN